MISARKIFKPYMLYLGIAIIQVFVYFNYAIGIIPSYKIDFISKNYIGYFWLFLYYALPISVSFLFNHNCSKVSLNCIFDISYKAIVKLSVLYMLISIYGMAKLGVNLFSKYGVIGTVIYMLTAQSRTELVTGNGNTILAVFSLASIILLSLIVDFKEKKYIGLYIGNVLIIFMYSSLLVSRIIFIQGIIFSIIIIIRRFAYENVIKTKYIISVGSVLLLFLIITSGYRDYDVEGFRYTESRFEWGLSRIADYSISTTNYSLEISQYYNNFSFSFPEYTFPIIKRINRNANRNVSDIPDKMRFTVGSSEYNNMGGITYMFLDFNEFFIMYVLVLGVMFCRIWKSYDKGSVFGVCLYPIIAYNIIESSRIFYLGTEMACVLFVVVAISIFIIRRTAYLKLK